MELFYGTGSRRTELSRLKLYGVDLTRRALDLHACKGNKDRVIPVTERVETWLTRYLDQARSKPASRLDDDLLFVTDYGEPFMGSLLGPLTNATGKNRYRGHPQPPPFPPPTYWKTGSISTLFRPDWAIKT